MTVWTMPRCVEPGLGIEQVGLVLVEEDVGQDHRAQL